MKKHIPLTYVLSFILIIMGFLVYSKSIGFEAVLWDDDLHITNNSHQTQSFLKAISFYWTHIYWNLYIPLTYSMWSLLGKMANIFTPHNPYLPFHLFQILLHSINSILVLLLASKFLKNRWYPLFIAGIFLLHPVQVESVVWMSELKGVLSTFFGLLTALLYLHSSKKPFSGLYYLALLFIIFKVCCFPFF